MKGIKLGWKVFVLAFVLGIVLLVLAHSWPSVAQSLGFTSTETQQLLIKELAYAFLISAIVGISVEVHAVRRHEELMDETKDKFLELSVGIAHEGLISASPVAKFCSLQRVVAEILKEKMARKNYEITLDLKPTKDGVAVVNEIGWTMCNVSGVTQDFTYRFQFDKLINGRRIEQTRLEHLRLGETTYNEKQLTKKKLLKLASSGEPICIEAPLRIGAGQSLETFVRFTEHRTTTDCAFWVMTMPCMSITLRVTCSEDLAYVVESLHPAEPRKPGKAPSSTTLEWVLDGGLLPGQGILVRWSNKKLDKAD